MQLTTTQLQTLKTAIQAETDPEFVGYRNAGDNAGMSNWYNEASAFVVYKTSETMAAIGATINYVAFEALTTANLEKINTFSRLNQTTVPPNKADIRSFWANVFSGALGGQGQATRDALDALWKRFATRGERLYATGTGTTLSPGALVFEGSISTDDVRAALALP